MGYYQGDYRGDFYRGVRGDPGFGSFFKSALGAVAGFIPGVGGIVSKGIARLGGGGGSAIVKTAASSGRLASLAGKAGQIVKQHPVLTGAGAAGTIAAITGGMGHHMGLLTGEAGQKGFHFSRKSGKMVRNRHMRVTNPRALRRALRRAHGFAKLAMKTIHLIHPKKKGRFGGFRKARKK